MPSGTLARHERRRQDREHAKGGDVPEQRADERYIGYIKYGVTGSRRYRQSIPNGAAHCERLSPEQ